MEEEEGGAIVEMLEKNVAKYLFILEWRCKKNETDKSDKEKLSDVCSGVVLRW